jgi:hypothetical protein
LKNKNKKLFNTQVPNLNLERQKKKTQNISPCKNITFKKKSIKRNQNDETLPNIIK